MAKLILMRHGRTLLNDGLPSSEANNVLTWRGVLATLAEAEPLKAENIAHIYSSTLPRAHQTAMLVVGAIGRGIPITLHPEIVEIVPREDDLHAEKPYEADDSQDRWKHDIFAVPSWGTESQFQVYGRIMRFFDETLIPRLEAGDTLLVVSHYFTMRAMQALIEDDDPRVMPRFRPRNSRPILYEAADVLRRKSRVGSETRSIA